jgi:hypothetical protein
MVKTFLKAAAVVALLVGCKPHLDDAVSLVTTARVLAVRTEVVGANAPGANAPGAGVAAREAEARITESVTLSALFVDGAGVVTPSPLAWSFCDDRKPLAELGPVNPRCLDVAATGLTALGVGSTAMGDLPTDACQQFGPDAPQPQAGQPPGRPVNPDPSGGYYQPIRVLVPGADGPTITIAETRVLCTLASFSSDVVAAYRQRYHRNSNPEVAAFGIKGAAAPWAASDANGTSNPVGVGQRLELEVSWPDCPVTDTAGDGVCGPEETGTTCGTCGPGIAVTRDDCCVDVNCTHARGCSGAERYARLDPASGVLVARRESMAVAWFATAGTFAIERAGRDNDDLAVTSDNTWQAPDAPGLVTMWVVLRDERGGVGWRQVTLDVR